MVQQQLCAYLSEALQVEDQYVGEGPQAHLHHPLLKLLTVRTPPGIIRSKLCTHKWARSIIHFNGYKNQM